MKYKNKLLVNKNKLLNCKTIVKKEPLHNYVGAFLAKIVDS